MRKSIVMFGLLSFLLALPARAAAPRWMPEQAGPWRVLFQPRETGGYINDHCLYRDPRGDWHLVGITSLRAPRFGTSEFWFAHGVGSLAAPMRELPALFKGWPDKKQKWAPHAIWEGDTLHLFAGPGGIRHFTSRDGYDFKFVDIAVKNRYLFLRDTMVLKLGPGDFLLYATDLVDRKDVISAWRSADLYHWTYAKVVFTAERPAPAWAPIPYNSACESPFVIRRDDGFYLSTTITNEQRDSYIQSPVFFSADPLDFGLYKAGAPGETAVKVATIAAHAPEYIEAEGKWWVTNAGWPGMPRPDGCPERTVCIAPLEWKTR